MATVRQSNDWKNRGAGLLDKLGMSASIACAVHCLVLSVLLVMAPVVTMGVFGSEWFHLVFLLLVVPVGAVAFWSGYKTHRQRRLLLAGSIGLIIIGFAALLEISVLPPLAASALTAAGGMLLVAAHWGNLRCRRKCRNSCSCSQA